MINKLRSWVDPYLYIYTSLLRVEGFILLASASLFITGFVVRHSGFFSYTPASLDPYPLLLTVIAISTAVLTLTKLAYQYLKSRNLSIELSTNGVEVSELQPNSLLESDGYIAIEAGKETVHYSKEVDLLLQSGKQIVAKVIDFPSTLVDKLLRQHADNFAKVILLKASKSRANQMLFINESKIGLASDIRLNTNGVNIYKTDYYTSYLTNEFSTSILRAGYSDKETALNGNTFFPNERKSLLHLEMSKLNNHIGVSTVLLSRDGYLIVLRQNSRAEQSQYLLVPTGSGSCDWTDFVEGDIRSTLLNGMKRELVEEAFWKTTGDSKDTLILGYFRWVRRGGKPEFTGITLSDSYAKDIVPNPKEVDRTDDDTYARPAHSVSEAICSIDAWLRQPQRLSVPLHMNLRTLKGALESNPNFWNKRLKSHLTKS